MHRFLLLELRFGDVAQELAHISYHYYAPILLISAAVSATFAAIMLSSREAKRLAGGWVKYIGWAFLAYSFQYFFRLLGWFIQEYKAPLQITFNLLANFSSGLTNLFFLIAALILLSKRDRFLTLKQAHLLQLYILVPLALIVLIPTAVTTATNFYFVTTEPPWAASLARLPDALISAFCLGLIGYAMMRNLITLHRHYLAIGVFIVGLIYGLVQLSYAVSPVWAAAQSKEILSALQSAPNLAMSQPVQFLDGMIFAVALPLKMLLFVPAVYLFFTLVIAAHDFRKVLRVVNERKRSYLSSDGIAAVIGQSLSADRVELFIRLPGEKTPSALRIAWPPKSEPSYLLLGKAADPRILEVFKGHEHIPFQQSRQMPWPTHSSTIPNESGRQVMLPVKFQGAVIGCLKVDFGQARRVTYAALQQLRSAADLLALALNEYRALASLNQLSDRFACLLLQMPNTSFDKTTRDMAVILHDVLSPLATEIILEAGFQSNHIFNGAITFRNMLQEQDASRAVQGTNKQVVRTNLEEVNIYTNELVVIPRENPQYSFGMGSLVLVLPSQHDEASRPTLGDSDLHRRTVASHTADALLDLARNHLSYELNGLSIRLNDEALTQEEWLRSVQTMACSVGLLWVGVTQTGSGKVLGEAAFADSILLRLDGESRSMLEATPISCVPFRDEKTGTRHVMRVELKNSEHQVWFGIAREEFGFELDFPSPWRSFLDDFRKIADSSLSAMFESMRSKEKVVRMAEELGVMNIALTTGHLMHQLANRVDEQLFPAESLWEAAARGDIKADEVQRTQLEAILGSARVMKRLISIFKNVTGTNLQRPCSLREVVVQALKFHEQIGQSGFRFKNKVTDDDYIIDVPYNIALFAVANLIGNSKDAISERRRQAEDGYLGEIRVEVESAEGEVICYVEDNGSGIPTRIREKLYTLGQSGKRAHNGWGLYFTKQSLGENGASIDLVETMPGRTRFRMKFPKAKSS